MNRSFLLHPGTILGTVVLVAALAGSVYGATTGGTATIGSPQIKNGSIKLADISPKARRALRGARGPAGLPGVASAGVAGPPGAPGAPGAPGTARAYGFVSSAGVLDAARSKNITATRLAAGTGVYCVTPTMTSGVTRSTAFPVVSADFLDGVGLHHMAQFVSAEDTSACPGGWMIVTHDFSAGVFSPSDNAFSIMVP